MPPAARMGDHTSHGGTLVLGEPTVLIGSRWAARLGDPHVCPMSDGPKPHVGGAVTSASGSVWIGGVLAARVGDWCACPSAGTVGVGVAPVVGPGAPPLRLTTDPDGRMNEQLDDDEPVTGPHAEIEITDSDQDGTHDTVRSSASVVRMRNDADTDIGGMRLKAEHELDVGYANKDARLAADGGLAYQENTELGMKRQKGCVSVGPSGDRPANPWLRACGEYQLLSTENGGDVWVGHDRGRYGFSAMGGMEAQAAQGKLEAETSIPIPFTDCTIDSGVSLEGDAVSHGKSGGVAMHYDSNKQRMNWQYKIPIGWLGLDVGLNLSIGRRYPTRDLREVMASLFVATGPNVIVTGDDSVLIG